MSTELATKNNAIVKALKAKGQEIQRQIAAPSGGAKIRGDVVTGKINVGDLSGEVLDIVVVDFITKRQYYDTPWRDGDPYKPPVCYGFDRVPGNMKPHNNVEEIGGEFQSETCATCPMNEWGTDGNGKACKERRLLLILPPDPAYAEEEFWQLDLPVMSTKSFDNAVREIDTEWGVPPVAAVMELSLVPGARYVQYEFTAKDENDELRANPLLEAHYARLEDATKVLDNMHFEPAEDEPQGNKKVARKKAAKKTVAKKRARA